MTSEPRSPGGPDSPEELPEPPDPMQPLKREDDEEHPGPDPVTPPVPAD